MLKLLLSPLAIFTNVDLKEEPPGIFVGVFWDTASTHSLPVFTIDFIVPTLANGCLAQRHLLADVG